MRTGKSLSEALLFASTNPPFDNRLFIVHENCKLRIPAELVVYTNCCFCFVFTFRTILVHNMFCRCCKLLKKIYLNSSKLSPFVFQTVFTWSSLYENKVSFTKPFQASPCWSVKKSYMDLTVENRLFVNKKYWIPEIVSWTAQSYTPINSLNSWNFAMKKL